jgi:hypothetical protein
MIDRAIAGDPGNAEMRFIRFMVQDGAPSFLDYDNREEDLAVFLDNCRNERETDVPAEFLLKMVHSMLTTDFPSSEQKIKLKAVTEH